MTDTISISEQIAASIAPFMMSRHTMSRSECIDMVKKSIDRAISLSNIDLLEELRKTEDLLINLQNEGRPVNNRLERVRKILAKY